MQNGMTGTTNVNGSYDVLVVGAGAGGLVAANRAHDLGLRVLLVEKSDRFGGTSAVSGGAIWVPNNPDNAARDSKEEALTYLKACTKGEVAEDRLMAYIDNAPDVVRYMAEKVGQRFISVPEYPDYYPALPGAKAGGRTMDPAPVDGSKLGEIFFQLREPYSLMKMMGRVSMTVSEARAFTSKKPGWQTMLLKVLLGYWLDFGWRIKTRRDRRLTMGNATTGGLLKGLVERNVAMLRNTQLVRLVEDGGRVIGAVLSQDGHEYTVDVRKGVILAAGGFERNQVMREQYLPQPTEQKWSITPMVNNTGDAIRAGIEIGAAVEFMHYAWWTPSMRLPSKDTPNTETRVGLFMERAFPGSVCVNRLGRRFANEAMSYNDFGYAMIADNEKTGANAPCWLVFDATFRRKYICGGLLPGAVAPDSSLPPEWVDNVFYRADTVEALAEKIGVDRAALADTVQRMNGYAATGVDPEFGRGGNVYDRYFGDNAVKPNPCLGPIEKAPFYAVRVDLGDIGTKGGLKVDAKARVLSERGEVIRGLYAVGNCSAAITADSYPGAGATLGPAMTFGYIAANDIASSMSNRTVEELAAAGTTPGFRSVATGD